jgi:hypothetical protein
MKNPRETQSTPGEAQTPDNQLIEFRNGVGVSYVTPEVFRTLFDPPPEILKKINENQSNVSAQSPDIPS